MGFVLADAKGGFTLGEIIRIGGVGSSGGEGESFVGFEKVEDVDDAEVICDTCELGDDDGRADFEGVELGKDIGGEGFFHAGFPAVFGEVI